MILKRTLMTGSILLALATGPAAAAQSSFTAAYLREWGGAGSGPGQFNATHAVGYLGSLGRVYVADEANHRIQYFDAAYRPMMVSEVLIHIPSQSIVQYCNFTAGSRRATRSAVCRSAPETSAKSAMRRRTRRRPQFA